MVGKAVTLLWPLLLGFVIGVITIVFKNQQSFFSHSILSPLGLTPEILSVRVPSKKPVIGFLPYWTMRDAHIPYHLLDYLAYFGVGLQADGEIKKRDEQNVEMGWYNLQGKRAAEILETAKKKGVGTMIVVTAFDNEVIDNLTSNPVAKAKAIQNIKNLVQRYNFDAVNIDFEYHLGKEVASNAGGGYSTFLKDLKAELETVNPNIMISVDLYANAFITDFPYQTKELEPYVDYLVLMGYDFHRAASTNAGPVAPLRSQTGKSITEAIESVIKKELSLEKVVLAIPFYGYEWQTASQEYGSPTYQGTGAMASYKRVHTLIKDEKLEPFWDFQAMAPWLVYEKDNVTKQIYFENDQSIGLKLQLVDQVNLGGIAFWALGYEGKRASVWNVVEQWRLDQVGSLEPEQVN